MRRDDGNALIAQKLSDTLQAKIRWGLLNTLTKGCSILACKSLQFLEVLSPFWTTSLRSCNSSPTHNRHCRATSQPQEDTGKFDPPELRLEQQQHKQQLQQLLSLSKSSECDGRIAGPRDRCAVRFKFQCVAGGNAAIVGPGIRYHLDFGYVFASGEYRYYGDPGHNIGALLEVAHDNNAVAVLLNRRNAVLVYIDKDDIDDGGDGVAEGPTMREMTTWTCVCSSGPICSCAACWWEWGRAAG